MHQYVALGAGQAVQPDHDLALFFLVVGLKVHTGEKGLHEHPLVAAGHVVVERFAGQVSFHLSGERLHVLLAQGGRLEAQIFPGVSHELLDGRQMLPGILL